MKQLFHIENGDSDSGQEVLSLIIGNRHGSFAISDRSGSELYQLAYCTTEEWTEKELSDLVAAYPSLQQPFYRVQVSFDFPQSILIPSHAYKPEDAGLLLNTLNSNGSNGDAVSELINEWQLYNIYSAPTDVREWLGQLFPAAQYRHQYSLGLKNINGTGNSGHLAVDFRKDDLTVIAVKGSKFLLAQTFEYSTPDDVLYYLLKICQQFSLSQQDVQLQLSGLVDKQSSLYKELYLYFIHIEFREANWKMSNDHPAHFFTSLNDLARCVS